MDFQPVVIPHRVWHEGPEAALLLHCSLAHAGAWGAVAEHLPERRLIAPDQAGHGRQDLWDGRRDLHDQTCEEAFALAPARFDLVGHSFGATVALRMALTAPERVRSLTLIEPPLFAAARAAGDARFALYHARHRRIESLIHDGQSQAALEAFHGDWGNGASLADLPLRSVDYMRERIGLIAAQGPVLMEDAAGLLVPGGLEGLEMPVVLLEGADSPPIAAAIQEALAARMPRAQRVVVEGAGHMLPLTHPAEVAGVLRGQFGI